MKLSILVAATTATLGLARPQYETVDAHQWIPGGKNDFRGPCPMLNTLANHGFLPRDGRNITRENAVKALGEGINFDAKLANIMWEQAIIANPEPNATFFTLDNLNVHNVLEHDASMSRSDHYLGNNHVFNQTVFDTTRKWWTDKIITAKQLANGKIYRQLASRATNPNYTFNAVTEEFSLGEVAAPIIVFGDLVQGTVRRDLVKFFFENERLPNRLGWSKKSTPVTLENILNTTAIIRREQILITGAAANTTTPHKRNLHSGIF